MILTERKQPGPIFCLLAGMFLFSYGIWEMQTLPTLESGANQREAEVTKMVYYRELDEKRSLTQEEINEARWLVLEEDKAEIVAAEEAAQRKLLGGGILLGLFFAFWMYHNYRARKEQGI